MEVRIIDGTTSPSGRLALAWGIPKVDHLDRLTDKQLMDVLDDARNFVVEKQARAVIGTIPIHTRRCRFGGTVSEYKHGGDHWAYSPHLDSHSFVTPYWSHNEDWVLVLHDGKWWYEAVYLGHRTATGFHFTEIGDAIEDAVRTDLRRRYPRAYDQVHRADGRNPYVELDKVHLLPPMLSVEVRGGVPKEDSPIAYRGRVDMRFKATAQSIHAEVTALRLKLLKDGS